MIGGINTIKLFKYLKRVIFHKYYVFINCCRSGIPWRGFVHDLSKFSLVEFIESVKYYDDNVASCEKCRGIKGISYCRLHHKGVNKHHWEYWIDIVDGKFVSYFIPYKYVVEMLCDWLGAERTYRGKQDLKSEYNYWKSKYNDTIMHVYTKDFITNMLYLRSITSDREFYKKLRSKELKNIYESMM